MDSTLRKKYMGVWSWRLRWITVKMITLLARVNRYKAKKTTKRMSLCCHPKMEKPSKVNSATAVKLDLVIEDNLGLKEMKWVGWPSRLDTVGWSKVLINQVQGLKVGVALGFRSSQHSDTVQGLQDLLGFSGARHWRKMWWGSEEKRENV